MRFRSPLALAAALAIAATMSGSAPARADDPELVVIVNPANDAAPTAAALESYFLRKEEHWPSGVVAVPLNFPPDSDVRRAFDRAVLAMTPDEVVRYWLDQRIRSGKSAPRELADPALIVKLVSRLKGAIGYVPASSAPRDVRVVARIRGAKILPP